MATQSDILAAAKVLLEIPTESNWSSSDLGTIADLAYRSIFNELLRNNYAFYLTEEEVTLTDAQEYTLINDFPKIFNITNSDGYEYQLLHPSEWPTDKVRICWYHRYKNKLKFFRKPEIQGTFTIIGPTTTDPVNYELIPYEWEHLFVLKTAILIGKSDKETVDGWREELANELQGLLENAGNMGPRFVREVDNTLNDFIG